VLVNADRGRLMQVFSNLLGNAIKFCQRGDDVRVSSALKEQSICISVCDTGPGISAETLPLIFEPHWAGAVKDKGTGLGLFISRRLVEAHGGTLSVARNPDRGVTFTFCLPVENEEARR
jgi:signal transduction histidine kinase